MILRKIEESDLLMILDWRNHPSIRNNMYNTDEIKLEEHKSWFNSVLHDQTKQYFIFQIDNIPLGVIGFTLINKKFNNATWAFYASPEAPSGTGSKMEYLALEYAFNSLKLHKLYCEVISFNQPVIKLHKKFGFEVEGIFKDQVFAQGQYHDVYRLALFSGPWNELSVLLKAKIFRQKVNNEKKY